MKITLPDELQSFSHRQALQTALEAALGGGEIIARNYGKSVTTKFKGVADLVTDVDYETDAFVQKTLRTSFPEIPILSEEGSGALSSTGEQWIVDPLDGTIAFVFQAGKEVPSVLIALRENGETILGVVNFPLTGELFYAVKGLGAFANGLPIPHAQGTDKLKSSWVAMNPFGDSKFESDNFRTLFRELRSARGAGLVTCEVPHSGMGCRVVAPGAKHRVIIHDNHAVNVKQAAWDTIPIQLIVEECGGVVVNAQGARYDPKTPELLIVAASRSLAEEVIGLLR